MTSDRGAMRRGPPASPSSQIVTSRAELGDDEVRPPSRSSTIRLAMGTIPMQVKVLLLRQLSCNKAKFHALKNMSLNSYQYMTSRDIDGLQVEHQAFLRRKASRIREQCACPDHMG
jgi:hypothetical protein